VTFHLARELASEALPLQMPYNGLRDAGLHSQKQLVALCCESLREPLVEVAGCGSFDHVSTGAQRASSTDSSDMFSAAMSELGFTHFEYL
jgi:hypothetical protein